MNKEQGFLLVVLSLAALLSLFLVLPFLQYILAAIIIAYILYPINEWVRPHTGRRVAPIFVMLAATVVIILPLAYITRVLIQDLIALSRGQSALNTADVETAILDVTGQHVDISESLRTLGTDLLGILFGNVTVVLSAGLTVLIGTGLALFLVYYLLRDGARFVNWMIDVAPMTNPVCHRLIDRVDRTAWGVIIGHLFVAVVQGIVGGIGLFVAGIPNVVFWTFVMIVLALLPIFGAFLVWAPAAAYLLLIDEVGWGLFLVAYGIVVVSTIDNYLRPIVIDREAHLNPAVIIIGVFGGLYTIGMTGLFVGPIVLAVLAAMITTLDEEYDRLGQASD